MPSPSFPKNSMLFSPAKAKTGLFSLTHQMRHSLKLAWFQLSKIHISRLQNQLFYQYARPSILAAFRCSHDHSPKFLPVLTRLNYSNEHRKFDMANVLHSKASYQIRSYRSMHSQTTTTTERVKLDSIDNLHLAYSTLPKSPSRYLCGEDALYIGENKTHDAVLLSVFDGVGGYREHGVDPAEYSNLMGESCGEEFFKNDGNLKDVLNRGYKLATASSIVGGTTAVLAKYTPKKKEVEVVNLGDSKAIIFTKSSGEYRIKKESDEQEHFFNCPYQLSLDLGNGNCADSPDKADVFKCELEDNDVVLLATDGLTDNIHQHEMLRILNETSDSGEEDFASATSRKMVSLAKKRFNQSNCETPFSERAQARGYSYRGGKLDDVTVIVGLVRQSTP